MRFFRTLLVQGTSWQIDPGESSEPRVYFEPWTFPNMIKLGFFLMVPHWNDKNSQRKTRMQSIFQSRYVTVFSNWPLKPSILELVLKVAEDQTGSFHYLAFSDTEVNSLFFPTGWGPLETPPAKFSDSCLNKVFLFKCSFNQTSFLSIPWVFQRFSELQGDMDLQIFTNACEDTAQAPIVWVYDELLVAGSWRTLESVALYTWRLRRYKLNYCGLGKHSASYLFFPHLSNLFHTSTYTSPFQLE